MSSLSPKSASYKPRNLLITGGAGFIMSHVVDACLAEFPDVHVFVFDILDYCASEKNLEEAMSTNRCTLIKGDVRNFDFMRYVLKENNIDTIIHGAAVSHVDLSFGNSIMFTETNTLGTHKLIEAVRVVNQEKRQIHRCIIVSTDEVYGTNDEQCYEDAKFDATNPYSASKAAMECICKSYIKSYKLPLIITRGNNVMGERQYPEKLIPKFILRMQRGMTLPIHGNGKQLRSYMYVKDCAEAFLYVLKYGKLYEEYNIEAGCEMTVSEVTERLLDVFNIPKEKRERYVTHVEDRHFNDQRYFINGNKLRALGWEAKTSFDEALKNVVAWYTEHQNYWEHVEGALDSHPKFGNYKK